MVMDDPLHSSFVKYAGYIRQGGFICFGFFLFFYYYTDHIHRTVDSAAYTATTDTAQRQYFES